MIKRTCLLVDDDDQSDIFPLIKKEGLKYNIDIDCVQFNIGSPSENKILKDQIVDVDLVLSVFRERYTGTKIDLIAVDWDLNNHSLTGPLFIKLLNDNGERLKIPKMLYSGVLKAEIEKICNEFKKETKNFNDIWKEINTLIETDIRKFVSRDNYNSEVVQLLRKVDDDFESSIQLILRNFPDFVFKNTFPNPQFKDKTFSQILNIVEKDSFLRNELNKEISEQVLAYLTEKI